MGHLSTSFLWLHCVAFMLITRSQYSSVSKRKVQLNLGTPLHRISIGILFLTQFSPSGLSNGFPPGFPGFPGLLGFPPGFLHIIRIIIFLIGIIIFMIHISLAVTILISVSDWFKT